MKKLTVSQQHYNQHPNLRFKKQCLKNIAVYNLLISVLHFKLSLGQSDFDENGNGCLKRGSWLISCSLCSAKEESVGFLSNISSRSTMISVTSRFCYHNT